MPIAADRQLGAAVMDIRDTHGVASAFQNIIEAAHLERRQVFPVGITRAVLDSACHADQLFNPGIIRRNLFVAHRPVVAYFVERSGLEIDLAKTRGGTAPEVGLTSCRFAPCPSPTAPRSDRICDIVLEEIESDLLLAIALPKMTSFRVSHTAILQFVFRSMIVVILQRVETLSGVERQDIESGLTEKLDCGAPPGAGADDDHVIDFFAPLNERHKPNLL